MTGNQLKNIKTLMVNHLKYKLKEEWRGEEEISKNIVKV